MINLLVDGVDTKTTYGFKYLRKEMGLPNSVTYGEEWLRNSVIPLLGKKKFTYTPLTCYFRYEGSQNDFETMKSILLKKFEKCTLKFSDVEFFYDVTYDSENKIENINPINIEIGINLKINSKYKSQITETTNRIATKTINVSGNSETPAIVEITPSVALVDLVVTGLGETFTLKNLVAGQKIIVNGEDCTILQGTTNRFSDYDSWDFPVLSPGANTITFSKSSCDVSIKYKPRWI